MKVKVTMETTLTVNGKGELEVLKNSDANTVVQTATLQNVPVSIALAKVRSSEKED